MRRDKPFSRKAFVLATFSAVICEKQESFFPIVIHCDHHQLNALRNFLPWEELIKYEGGIDEILRVLDESYVAVDAKDSTLINEEITNIKENLLKNEEFLNNIYSHSNSDNEKLQQLLELLNLAESKYGNSKKDDYISWLKAAYLNSISNTLNLYSTRLITSITNDKINFFPQIDDNIIYFLTSMIEQLSVTDYCKYCEKELFQNKESGKKSKFCNGKCYNKFIYKNKESCRDPKKINNYIGSILRNRQGKDTINLELKKELCRVANKLLNENQSYDDVRKYIKKLLDEQCPLK